MSSNAPRPTTVLLDVGWVVLRVSRDLVLPLNGSGKVLRVPWEQISELSAYDQLERGSLDPSQFFSIIKEEFAIEPSVTAGLFQKHWNELLLEEVPGVSAVLSRLRPEVGLFGLSNTNPLHYRYFMEAYPVFKAFKQVFSSVDFRCRKPEPEIYHRACEAMNLKPEEIIFLDDLEPNVDAARRAGMHSERVRDSAQRMESIFNKLGLLR